MFYLDVFKFFHWLLIGAIQKGILYINKILSAFFLFVQEKMILSLTL